MDAIDFETVKLPRVPTAENFAAVTRQSSPVSGFTSAGLYLLFHLVLGLLARYSTLVLETHIARPPFAENEPVD